MPRDNRNTVTSAYCGISWRHQLQITYPEISRIGRKTCKISHVRHSFSRIISITICSSSFNHTTRSQCWPITALTARVDLSVRPSVCLSVRQVPVFVTLSSRIKIRSCGFQHQLGCGEVKFVPIFAGDHPPAKALKWSIPYCYRKFDQ